MPSYYAVVPASVRYDKKLPPGAKLLYGEITCLCNDNGSALVTNKYFADVFDVKISTIKKWLKSLISKAYIDVIHTDDDTIKDILINKKLVGYGVGDNACEWCNVNTVVLHDHHYPIYKKDGGKQIVKICPNCHHEFHNFNMQFRVQLINVNIEDLIQQLKSYE